MSETPDVQIEEPAAADAETPKKKRRWPFGKEKPPPRSVLMRLFGVSIWGGVKLALLCIIVGFFVLAAQFDPRDPDVDMGRAIAAMARSTVDAAGWAARNFWKPALAGAGIVLPLWVIWRLVTLPFRR